MERKNGWQLAEQAGDATPDGVQRLLYNYVWDADLVRGRSPGLRGGASGGGQRCAGGGRDGFLKKGTKSVGVQRQYSGDGGSNRELPDRSIPELRHRPGEGTDGSGVVPAPGMVRGWGAAPGGGSAEGARFQTKPQLAQKMVERAVESGVPFGWFAGDTVYGNDRKLRRWLEQREIPHILAVKSNEKLWAWTEEGPRQVRADRLASQVEESDWARLSAGDGSKGPRIYDWTWVAIRPLREPGKGYWLLVRRRIAQPEELAFYVCFGPAETTLEELVKVAGIRWTLKSALRKPRDWWGWTSMR